MRGHKSRDTTQQRVGEIRRKKTRRQSFLFSACCFECVFKVHKLTSNGAGRRGRQLSFLLLAKSLIRTRTNPNRTVAYNSGAYTITISSSSRHHRSRFITVIATTITVITHHPGTRVEPVLSRHDVRGEGGGEGGGDPNATRTKLAREPHQRGLRSPTAKGNKPLFIHFSPEEVAPQAPTQEEEKKNNNGFNSSPDHTQNICCTPTSSKPLHPRATSRGVPQWVNPGGVPTTVP